MHPADKAVLRLAIGMGLAVLIAYGLGLPLAFVVPALAIPLLCRPGPPIPLAKAVVASFFIAALLVAGVLMVPLLEHYRVAGLLVTGAVLYALFFAGARSASPLTIFLVIAVTVIPVAGVAEQALSTALAQGLALGVGIGASVSGVSHALFPDPPALEKTAAPLADVTPEAAGRSALQATLIVMPVFTLALTNPALYLMAIMKTVAMSQQAGATNARTAGRELVGSTLVGAVLAMAIWWGLTLWPNLWMLMLWVVAAAFWTGVRLFRVKATAEPPSFWINALMTMLILLGPAIEDAAVGRDVYKGSAVRVSIFIGVALYAWITVWALESWRASRSRQASVHLH